MTARKKQPSAAWRRVLVAGALAASVAVASHAAFLALDLHRSRRHGAPRPRLVGSDPAAPRAGDIVDILFSGPIVGVATRTPPPPYTLPFRHAENAIAAIGQWMDSSTSESLAAEAEHTADERREKEERDERLQREVAAAMQAAVVKPEAEASARPPLSNEEGFIPRKPVRRASPSPLE